MRSKWSLIRPNCVWRHLWSDPIALKVASDQTKVRSNPPMIRPNCARNCLWSDPSALESAYDQTFQTKMTSDQTISRPWSDRSALELPKRPCNFGLGTHGCALDWVWSEVHLGLDLNLGMSSNWFNGTSQSNHDEIWKSSESCFNLYYEWIVELRSFGFCSSVS